MSVLKITQGLKIKAIGQQFIFFSILRKYLKIVFLTNLLQKYFRRFPFSRQFVCLKGRD